MKDLVIIGTGGHARELHQLVEDINSDGSSWNVVGFIDDDQTHAPGDVHGLPVLGTRAWLAGRNVSVALGVGSTSARWKLVRELIRMEHGIDLPALVHPNAWLGNRISVGAGTIVFAGGLITTDLKLGDAVIVNLDCTISHDTSIGDYVTLAPGVNISGSVSVGEGCDLGAAAAVIQGISIGSWTVVGAGAVVVDNLPANVTAVGVPARPIKQRDEGWYRA